MRRLTGLTLTAVVLLSSCSNADRDTDTDTPPPQAAAEELILDDAPGSTAVFHELDTRTAPPAFVEEVLTDPPGGAVSDVDPEECQTAGSLARPAEETEQLDVVGRTSYDEEFQWSLTLLVVKGGRSLEDVRDGREDCTEFTVSDGDGKGEYHEELGDGPEIDGAEDSFASDVRYETTGEEPRTNNSYLVAAQVRGVIVIARVVAPSAHQDEPVTEQLKSDAEAYVSEQVARVDAAD